jgi:hypothetical protein
LLRFIRKRRFAIQVNRDGGGYERRVLTRQDAIAMFGEIEDALTRVQGEKFDVDFRHYQVQYLRRGELWFLLCFRQYAFHPSSSSFPACSTLSFSPSV